MLFPKNVLIALANDDDAVFGESKLELVETSDWESDERGKYQTKMYIFSYEGKFYQMLRMRSGSAFTDWEYDDDYMDCNLPEVTQVEKVIKVWEAV